MNKWFAEWTMREGQPHVIHLKDHEVPGYLIEQTALDVELGEEETRVRAPYDEAKP